MSDNATKHALILAGIGWGSLPLWLIERDLAEGRLVRIAAAEFSARPHRSRGVSGQQGDTFVRAKLAGDASAMGTNLALHNSDALAVPFAWHFRSACRDGIKLGQQIGRRAFAQYVQVYRD